MKKKFGKKRIAMIGIAVVILAGAGYTFMNSGQEAETELVSKTDVRQIVSDNGVVEAEGTILLTSKAPVDIIKLYVNEGDFIEKGALILDQDQKSASLDVSALKAQAAGIAAQAANANATAAKSKTLYEQGAISLVEYNAAKTAAAQLNAQLASMNYSIQSYQAGSSIGGLMSPISGYITEMFGKEGETVMPGMSIAEISPLESFYIKLNLIPEEANKVAVGDPASIMQKDVVLSDDCQVAGISRKAKEVVSSIGISQKRVEVLVKLNDEFKDLILGDNVKVEIVTEEAKDVLAVSNKGIFEIDGKDHVYVVVDGKAALVLIETGLKGEDYTQVTGGVKEGDQIILSPGNSISDGVKIK